MKKRAFTLVEIIVSISILSIIMLAIIETYSHIIALNKRLELGRILQENSRLLTESIAKDVRSNGIDFEYYDESVVDKQRNYTTSGASVLSVAMGPKYYLMQQGETGEINACTISIPKNPCFFGKEENGEKVRLTDPRVEVSDLKFFISGKSGSGFVQNSGGNTVSEGKASINFSMKIASGKGITQAMVNASEIHIQTTISEKLYKTQ